MHVAQACLLNTPPCQFWFLADDYPDLVSRLHIQERIIGNFGISGGVPWLSHTQGALCFICKENVENVSHFLHDCTEFRQNFDSIWLNLKQKFISANPIDGSQIFDFISHLDRQQKTLVLLGGGGCPSHLIKLQSLCSTGSYVRLSVKFIVLEKTGCVSCRHHGLKSKVIFLCF